MSSVMTKFAETPELLWVVGGLLCYAAGIALAATGSIRSTSRAVGVVALVGAALLCVAIIERWVRSGYGPFYTLFEILLSSLFSLGLISAAMYLFAPLTRAGAIITLAVLFMLGLWALNVPSGISPQPATYDSIWLWVHVGVGKAFLGLLLVAVGMAGSLLLMRTGLPLAAQIVSPDAVDDLSWRLVAVAFVFHSLMLIAGAVWAQDAWGRFWAWDPLETWTLITWLAIGAGLHVRLAYRIPRLYGSAYILVLFALSFMTFFGVPFTSVAAHKGITL